MTDVKIGWQIYVYIYIYNILYKTNIFYHILVQRNAFPSTGGLAMGTLSRSESKSDRGHFRGTTPRFWVANSIGMCKKHHQISAVGPAAESSSVQLWTSLLDFWAFSFLGTKRWERPYSSWCDLDTWQIRRSVDEHTRQTEEPATDSPLGRCSSQQQQNKIQ